MRDDPSAAEFSRRENSAVETSEEDLFGPPASEPEWLRKYRDHTQYEWEDFDFLKTNKGPDGGVPIPLTRGYFAIVCRRDLKRMTQYPDGTPKKWHAKVKYESDPRTGEIFHNRIVKVYAARRGRKGEPAEVLMHRELARCLKRKGDVDHFNGIGLDNRLGTPKKPINLKLVSLSENRRNIHKHRTTNLGLPTGVKRKHKRFVGVISIDGERRYSKESWDIPGPAHEWYKAQVKKLHKSRKVWRFLPTSVDYFSLPPETLGEAEMILMEEAELDPERAALADEAVRTMISEQLADRNEDIPF